MIFVFLGLLIIYHYSGCNPVPNPGTADPCLLDYLMRQTDLRQFLGSHPYSCEGEGCRGTTTTTEADTWQSIFHNATANSGNPPPVSGHTQCFPSPATNVHKRSFKRACRRAIRFGTADYHGQRLHLRDFPETLISKLRSNEPSVQPHRSIPVRTNSKRLTCLSWNSGGMSQASFHELKHWLRLHPVDIVMVAETRWGFESFWTDQDWTYLHSATGVKRSGGLLVMLSRRFAHSSQIGTIVWYLAGYCTYGFMDIRRPLILLPCISTRTIALIAPIDNESQSGRHLINVLAIYQYGTIFCVQGISTAISRPTRRGLELRNFSGRHRVSLDPPTRINRGSKTCSVLMA